MTIEESMTLLYEMKQDLKARRKAYNKSVKNLKESIRSLEAVITADVIESKQTITVGNLRAEYKPAVVFKMKREDEKDD